MGRIVRAADVSRALSLALRDSHARWIFPVLLAAAWAVYHPALNRVFTADQVWYFAELNGNTSLIEGLRRVDYAAARQYWKGDESLFRPLLFVWLAVENTIFSYHHLWWNAANLLLHALVAFLLFRLLLTVRRTWWAFGAALLFAVVTPPLELVLWNHLGGYIFACAFLAIGLRAFLQLLQGSDEHRRAQMMFVLSFTAAALFYETMVPISILAALLVIAVTRRLRLVLFTPALVFVALYLVHAHHVARLFYVDSRAPTHVSSIAAASWRWTLEFAFPAWLTITPAPFDRFQTAFLPQLSSLPSMLNLVVVALAATVALTSVSRVQLKRSWPLLVLLAGSLGLYAAVICLGRPLSLVLSSGYYPYMPCLLLLVFFFSVIDFDRVHGWRAILGGAALSGAIALHAASTYAVALESGRMNSEPSRLLLRISRFVDQHRGEPDFTFVIRSHLQSLDPQIALLRGYPDDAAAAVEKKRLTEIVFARFYDEAHPKYVFEQSEH